MRRRPLSQRTWYYDPALVWTAVGAGILLIFINAARYGEPGQSWWKVTGLLVILLALISRLAFSGVYINDSKMVIANLLRHYSLPWEQIESVEVRRQRFYLLTPGYNVWQLVICCHDGREIALKTLGCRTGDDHRSTADLHALQELISQRLTKRSSTVEAV